MAFDMHFQNRGVKRKEKIDHHEEFIFQLMEGDEKYPIANFIWENFYNGPQISTEKSNQLVHELLQFKNESVKHNQFKQIQSIVDRLTLFFSAAYRNKVSIMCISD
ncbi:MAG: hypothetical protein AAFN93_03565 [Bacteroidota bacterium]